MNKMLVNIWNHPKEFVEYSAPLCLSRRVLVSIQLGFNRST